ncbi:UDP-N-acetylmuramoyl-L-alanyl-D-glutamate--2,6-diaminopimelate ligase [Wenzhouxiangella marina]|uniref:UDP-N-acetylmuramoyl-L-alanyl-D-glutamate--2,6-diaminopimelate ligase n=1 Tax=Wenzhouxiangella marina TaxID=1579979 RepID=A0A0K0XYN2_9GAMM|nr:UDP-N-acetylmuramoyl-L-alanyl-D-glutamate--2,6-diaminopimelate ligase [Wenzhouxiangella marina]AKS42731.1 UDP-N-acetylmuramoyl-L-alanyl-D-glutamate--2,6-diaminopimelate ligase [Wenzhouxiangella marina]MBB6088579.1 UDP-N-acetylmuramoyl-L-alanyl-D-glutamate--2,6-diaminopimelate ligase [Wenzhouxiangella marina]
MTEARSPRMLDRLLEGLVTPGRAPAVEFSSLVLDARSAEPGDVFVALAGHRRHGMEFIDQAIERGAVAVLHDGAHPVPDRRGLAMIEVNDLAVQLPELARRCWGDPCERLELLAVTGTNGKTSVAWLLAQALDAAMIGTLGIGRPGAHRAGTHTTPDLFSVYRHLSELADAGERTVVFEASSHALDQQRLAGLRFRTVIFTTLGHDHLDYHADLQAYGEAKARLFQDYASERQIINVDDAFGRELAERLAGSGGLRTLAVRAEQGADVHAEGLRADRDGLVATLHGLNAAPSLEIRSGLLGEINLYNLMIVAVELDARGLSAEELVRRIAALRPVPGRMQPIAQAGRGLAVIDYAHTPDALETALKSLRTLEPGALWCVFGCGGDRDREKRPMMGRIAEALADRVILTNDNPRHEAPLSIVRAIQGGMRHPERAQVLLDRAEAIARALAEAAPEDVILIAGKGHETEQVVGDQRHAFSDLDAVRSAFGRAA